MDAPLVENDQSSSNMYEVMQGDDLPGPENKLINESLKKDIERSLSILSQREGEILKLFYGLGGIRSHSLDEIGLHFELTRERVRQIKEKALRRLKGSSKNKILRYITFTMWWYEYTNSIRTFYSSIFHCKNKTSQFLK